MRYHRYQFGIEVETVMRPHIPRQEFKRQDWHKQLMESLKQHGIQAAVLGESPPDRSGWILMEDRSIRISDPSLRTILNPLSVQIDAKTV